MQRGSRSAAGRHQKYQPAPWFTRVRALLAGALVLGVGATLTLASWTDQEYAQGSFATSTFAIEGAADGTFGDHSATPAPLLFTATAAAMSPGSITYSRFVVRTTAATTVAGTVQMSGATVGGAPITFVKQQARDRLGRVIHLGASQRGHHSVVSLVR